MQTIDLTALINAVIALCAALITTRLIPWINSRISKEQAQSLEFWTGVAVRAAEQYFGSKSGQEKKSYVMSFLASRGFSADDALIEAQVNSLFGTGESVKAQAEDESASRTAPADGTAAETDDNAGDF